MNQSTLPDDVRRLMPLTPAVFYVLLSLSAGARHGYAIMQETQSLSTGSFRMGPATLYSTIQRLATLDLVHETGSSAEDSRRRYYELTDLGRTVLREEVAQLNSVVMLANARLAPGAMKE